MSRGSTLRLESARTARNPLLTCTMFGLRWTLLPMIGSCLLERVKQWVSSLVLLVALMTLALASCLMRMRFELPRTCLTRLVVLRKCAMVLALCTLCGMTKFWYKIDEVSARCTCLGAAPAMNRQYARCRQGCLPKRCLQECVRKSCLEFLLGVAHCLLTKKLRPRMMAQLGSIPRVPSYVLRSVLHLLFARAKSLGSKMWQVVATLVNPETT